jgi:hypothetical protein
MARAASDWRKLAEQARLLAQTSKAQRERNEYLRMAEDFEEEARRVEKPESIH